MSSATLDIQSVKQAVENYRAAFSFGQAYELLQEALENCSDQQWENKLELANCFKSIHCVDQSIQIASSLVDSGDPAVMAAANSQLAIFFELTGQFALAEEAINQCIDIHPNAVEPQVVLARILSHQGEHERAIRVLELVFKKYQPRDVLSAVRICYQMAHSCDALGMYEHAFQWALKAKEAQKQIPNARKLAQYGIRLLNSMLKAKPAATAAPRHINKCDLPFQPVHLIGFPRSGTTLLGELISRHPDVYVSSELPVVANQIMPQWHHHSSEPLDSETLQRLRELYCQSHLNCRRGTDESVIVDKKPTNLLFVQELLTLLPSSKFIVAMRDPRDVIISCFIRYFPLTDMSANFLSLGSGCTYYAAYMQIWRRLKAHLDASNSVVIRYRDLCEATEQSVSAALELVGQTETQLQDEQLKPKYIHSPTFAEVRKPINSGRLGRWKNYQRFLEPYLKILDPIAAELGYNHEV